jgi:transposase-like protein
MIFTSLLCESTSRRSSESTSEMRAPVPRSTSTNALNRSRTRIERLHEEFRRRVKTQGSLPSEDAALVLLFSLVASGQIKLRRIDGWRKIAAVVSQHTAVAA